MSDDYWAEYVNDDVKTVAEALAEIDQMPVESVEPWKFRMTNAGRLCVYTLSDVYIIHYDHLVNGGDAWSVHGGPEIMSYRSWWDAVASIIHPDTSNVIDVAFPGDQ